MPPKSIPAPAPASLRLHYSLDAVRRPVRALLDGSETERTVVQLNLDTAVIDRGELRLANGAEFELVLRIGWAEFGGLRARALAFDDGDGRLVALRYRGLSYTDGQGLLAMLHRLLEGGEAFPPPTSAGAFEELGDREAIRAVCASLCRHRATVRVTTPSGAVWCGPARPLVEPHPLPLRAAWPGPTPYPPLRVELGGYNSLFRFHAPVAGLVGGELRLPLPGRLERLRHRQRRRVRVGGVSCRFRHPLWPTHRVVRAVRDFGTTGFGILTDPESDLLYPGLQLERVDLLADGEMVCSGPAIVCHVSRLPLNQPRPELHDYICGLAFRPVRADADARWLNLVHRHLHPVARSGAFWRGFSWHVYETSGYFELSGKHSRDFDRFASAYDRSSRRLDAAPWLGIQAVWPSGRGVEATFTFVKIYSGTWFGFQLAKWPGAKDKRASTQRVLLGLYLRAFEHMQHDRAMRWVAGYLEARVKWNEVAQFGWARGQDAAHHVCLVDMRLLEGDARPANGAAFEVEPATEADLNALDELLERTRPWPWRDALDLTRRRFSLRDTARLWGAARMLRERRFVVVRVAGRPAAMAMMETGEDGVSLFSLLDGVRLFALEPDAERFFPALLDAARAWYHELGRPHFCVLHEDGDHAAMLELGLRDLGPGKLWAVSHEVLPDFLEHVHMLLSPRLRRLSSGSRAAQ